VVKVGTGGTEIEPSVDAALLGKFGASVSSFGGQMLEIYREQQEPGITWGRGAYLLAGRDVEIG
jgi:hypothetical protein